MSAKQPTWPAGSQSMAVIFGTQGRDTIDGTGFDDVIRGWAQGGDGGADLGDLLSGLAGKDDLLGGGGDDTLLGGVGNDTGKRHHGDDTRYGGGGAATLSRGG